MAAGTDKSAKSRTFSAAQGKVALVLRTAIDLLDLQKVPLLVAGLRVASSPAIQTKTENDHVFRKEPATGSRCPSNDQRTSFNACQCIRQRTRNQALSRDKRVPKAVSERNPSPWCCAHRSLICSAALQSLWENEIGRNEEEAEKRNRTNRSRYAALLDRISLVVSHWFRSLSIIWPSYRASQSGRCEFGERKSVLQTGAPFENLLVLCC